MLTFILTAILAVMTTATLLIAAAAAAVILAFCIAFVLTARRKRATRRALAAYRLDVRIRETLVDGEHREPAYIWFRS